MATHKAVLSCALLAFAASSLAADAEPAWHVRRVGTVSQQKLMGQTIVALTEDLASHIWIATEDSGLWSYDPNPKNDSPLKFYGTDDGLPDDEICALSCDGFGRIWAGHFRSGVSVFCGGVWKNYSRLDGPIGERIYKIKVSPLDGSVWLGTNAGLTRFNLTTGKWTHFTTRHGLPENEIGALDFEPDGTVLVGTLCAGLAKASPVDDYAKWTVIQSDEMLNFEFAGSGLPSNQINDVMIARDGVYWVGTPFGLAKSIDKGANWSYQRGANFKEKIRINYKRILPGTAALAEDFVNCLAEDEHGRIWVGHRSAGLEIYDPKSGATQPVLKPTGAEDYHDFISALLIPREWGRSTYVGCYGAGFVRLDAANAPKAVLPAMLPPKGEVLLPKPIPAPSETVAKALVEKWTSEKKSLDLEPRKVVTLDDDWRTRGDWLGRRGTYFAELCGFSWPHNLRWGAGKSPVEYREYVGPNFRQQHGPHVWVHSEHTDNENALEYPRPFLNEEVENEITTYDKGRKEAEKNDGGYNDPYDLDGPDLYMDLKVPAGTFILSTYFHNKDGHVRRNRTRDYLMRIYENKGAPGDQMQPVGELARTRVKSFWFGVYKRFLVRGPIDLTVEIRRNFGNCVIVSGVFLDEVTCKPEPYFADKNAVDVFGSNLDAARFFQDADLPDLTENAHAVERFIAAHGPDAPPDGNWTETAAQACFTSSNFAAMEKALERSIGITARKIEKRLQTKGTDHEIFGKGREHVLEYLKR